ncbi:MAG: hypothetical protein J3K34DRAFT_471908 [Monoraphidium minutum]|nr:MAG: hypothetical protein J3K34DRAFT_471908 [Monoraphidium minutum]
MASTAAPQGEEEFLAVLGRCPSATLVFDDGSSLPVSREVLAVATPVLCEMLAATAPGADAGGVAAGGAGGGACGAAAPAAAVVPLPGDRRADWLLALRMMFDEVPEAEVWEGVAGVAELALKYDVAGLRAAADNFIPAGPVWEGYANRQKAGINTAISSSRWSMWCWLELAGRCGLPATLKRCVDLIAEQATHYPDTCDLGAAAEPLVRRLLSEVVKRR